MEKITYQQAAELLGVSEITVRKAVEKGYITRYASSRSRLTWLPKEQVELFRGKRISLHDLSLKEKELWEKCKAIAEGIEQEAPALAPSLPTLPPQALETLQWLSTPEAQNTARLLNQWGTHITPQEEGVSASPFPVTSSDSRQAEDVPSQAFINAIASLSGDDIKNLLIAGGIALVVLGALLLIQWFFENSDERVIEGAIASVPDEPSKTIYRSFFEHPEQLELLIERLQEAA